MVDKKSVQDEVKYTAEEWQEYLERTCKRLEDRFGWVRFVETRDLELLQDGLGESHNQAYRARQDEEHWRLHQAIEVEITRRDNG